MRARALAGLVACAAVACGGEHPATVAGPPLTTSPPDAAAADAGPGATPDSIPHPAANDEGPPITATFIDLTTSGAPLKTRPCDRIVVSVARGKASAVGEELAVGDFLVVHGDGAFDVRGSGVALVAALRPAPPHSCTRAANGPPEPLDHQVVRAGSAPELAWGGGKMKAHLDVEADASGVYFGRLEAGAAVAEHAHEGSWEVLGAVDGAGTFVLDGKPRHIGARDVVVIPPKTKHAFTPDAGSALVAIQFYSPAGPEQRLRALAAAASGPGDAGARGSADGGSDAGAPKKKRSK